MHHVEQPPGLGVERQGYAGGHADVCGAAKPRGGGNSERLESPVTVSLWPAYVTVVIQLQPGIEQMGAVVEGTQQRGAARVGVGGVGGRAREIARSIRLAS